MVDGVGVTAVSSARVADSNSHPRSAQLPKPLLQQRIGEGVYPYIIIIIIEGLSLLAKGYIRIYIYTYRTWVRWRMVLA